MIDFEMLKRHRWTIFAASAGLAASIAVAATLAPSSNPAASLPARDKAAIEAVVREYILAHPEIIPEAIERLRDKQSADAYARNKAALEKPFAGAWAGAEDGKIVVAMFSDYACGYCRASMADVTRLIADNKDVKFVWREIPILGPGSDVAARGALAAALQGKYRDFHSRMFAAGRPDEGRVTDALKASGVDLARARTDMASAAVASEIRNNLALAGEIDDSGIATPTFVIGGQVLKGAVGYDALKAAVAKARKS
ncbi:DsbA family protein [Sphingomonas crocodyli]|nr:DsbA family protein [Sphingomonas crocodyli]